MDISWIDSTDALAVKALPESGNVLYPKVDEGVSYPVEAEGVMCLPGAIPRDVRRAELAATIRAEAAKRGATTVYVSEPQYRELEQTYGEPSPLSVDSKVGQEYCYVAYVTPTGVSA